MIRDWQLTTESTEITEKEVISSLCNDYRNSFIRPVGGRSGTRKREFRPLSEASASAAA